MEIVTFVELDIGSTTYRFGYASEEQIGYAHIPSLKSVSVRPAVLDPGESIGQRESITISLIDHLHIFDTDEFSKGTFWTKFRARYKSVEGAPLRVLRGQRGQQLSDMDTYLYVAQDLQISRSGATITAKDPLSFLNSKAAQAPFPTQGELSATISDTDMAFTLVPVGIGNAQYPASGKGVLGGRELVSFTRVGDAFTMTARGENIDPQEHDEGTKFQLALVYTNVLPSVMLNDLLTNYTEVDPAWITISDWQQSVDAFINRVYSAIITDPTSVNKLLDELCEQIGLIFYWDAFAKQIRVRPLVAAATSRLLTEDEMMDGSLTVVEQSDKRVSHVITYYGQRDPTQRVDEPNNYRRVLVKVSPNAGDFKQPAIRKIFSRWISFPARTTAERLNDLIVSRYQIPPRKFRFSLFRNEGFLTPPPSAYLDLSHWFLVDEDGERVVVNAQVTSVAHDDAEFDYDAEEVRFAGDDDTLEPEVDKYVFIDGDLFNINLRTLYNQIYSAPNPGDQIYFVIESGVRVGGNLETGSLTPNVFNYEPSLVVGNWPEAVDLFLIINGRVQGQGGRGASYTVPESLDPVEGAKGGIAIFTRRAITITNNGSIWGGAGGGSFRPQIITIPGIGQFVGQGAGGGGAGFLPGKRGTHLGGSLSVQATDGTEFAGGTGAGSLSSNGGGPGQPGDSISGVPGGSAGEAVDGVSFVTFAVVGDILGPQIN